MRKNSIEIKHYKGYELSKVNEYGDESWRYNCKNGYKVERHVRMANGWIARVTVWDPEGEIVFTESTGRWGAPKTEAWTSTVDSLNRAIDKFNLPIRRVRRA